MPRSDLVVLDFETSGLSPALGDRPIEIGAVLIRSGRVVDQFQSLMNPGFKVSSFIQDYTGISNKMLATAPPCESVMAAFAAFITGSDLVAHNASFDSKFLDAELNRLGLERNEAFACSMLTARRVIPSAPNYKLGTLVDLLGIRTSGQAHRALADAQAASGVWLHMIAELKRTYALRSVPFELMQRLGKIPKKSVPAFMAEQVSGRR